jgi:hypothetical protein
VWAERTITECQTVDVPRKTNELQKVNFTHSKTKVSPSARRNLQNSRVKSQQNVQLW